LANCPEGTAKTPKLFLAFVLVAFAIFVSYLFSRKKKADALKAIKHRHQIYEMLTRPDKKDLGIQKSSSRQDLNLEVSLNGDSRVAAPGDEDRIRFDIEFKDLELKLPSGLKIMQGVSGKLRSGKILITYIACLI
jgi:hypothetical protein